MRAPAILLIAYLLLGAQLSVVAAGVHPALVGPGKCLRACGCDPANSAPCCCERARSAADGRSGAAGASPRNLKSVCCTNAPVAVPGIPPAPAGAPHLLCFNVLLIPVPRTGVASPTTVERTRSGAPDRPDKIPISFA